MSIWRDEIFSQANAADSLAEVIKLINESSCGLSESLSTLDFGDTETFISSVTTGQVAVNLPASGWDIRHSFASYEFTGSAHKGKSLEAINFYSRVKASAALSH